MSGKNYGGRLPMKGWLPVHEPPFSRNLGLMSRHALLEEMREAQFGMDPRQRPPHPVIIEEHLAAQHQEIQGLLLDNQRLAATHVALQQELESVQHELQQADHFGRSFHTEKDKQLRELYEKSVKMETDFRVMEAMKPELMQLSTDTNELTAERHKLTAQVQAMTRDLGRATADSQQVLAVTAEIESLKHKLKQGRAAIEYEKKGYAENYEHGQMMEKKLILMARELEKLRAEMANADKRSHAVDAVRNSDAGCNGNYGNPVVGYSGNPYPASYGVNAMDPMNPAQAGGEGFSYTHGPHGPGTWGAYDMK